MITEAVFMPQTFLGIISIMVIVSFFLFFMFLKNSKIPAADVNREGEQIKQVLEQENAAYKKKNDELAKNLESLKAQIDALNKDAYELNSLKAKLETAAKEKTECDALKAELQKKDEAMRNEMLAKEKLWTDLHSLRAKEKEMEAEIVSLKSTAVSAQDIENLKQQLLKKEQMLKEETAAKEKIAAEFKNTEGQILNLQNELKSSQEVYNGLKEQYADLERTVDALNQSLALEKSMHQRLKDEVEEKNIKQPPV